MDRQNYIKNYRSHLCNESRVMWKRGQPTFESRNVSQSRKSCKFSLLKQIHEATTLLDSMIRLQNLLQLFTSSTVWFLREKNLISFSFLLFNPLLHSSQIFASGTSGLSQSER